MAELGVTDDVAALVPGDPAVLRETARGLRERSRVLAEAADGLGRITTPDGWSGTAADAFRSAFDAQPQRWREAANAFESTSRTVDDHAAVMEWARERAAEGVARWREGEAATSAARSRHDPVALGPFVDPGDPARAEARAVLADARARLRESGDRSATAVTAACEAAPEGPGFWEELADDAAVIGAQVGNAAASLGNAMLHHPGDVGAMAVGGALATVSAVGVAGSIGLDATGVGAIGGIPLGAISAAGVIAGGAMAGAGAIDLTQQAMGDDRVEPFTVATDANPGEEVPLPPADRIPTVGEPGANDGVRTLPTEQDIQDLYDELASNGTPATWNAYPGSAVRLPDGTEIGLRGESQSGGTTLDARLPNGDRWKVHLPRR